MKRTSLLFAGLAAVAAIAVALLFTLASGKNAPQQLPVTAQPGPAADKALPDEFAALLANYRKIIVLLAGEAQQKEKERAEANRVGQALFHENLARLANFDLTLKTIAASPAAERVQRFDAMLSYIESEPSLYDADRLAFGEVLLRMQKALASEQTLPALKLHKRVGEDLASLNEPIFLS